MQRVSRRFNPRDAAFGAVFTVATLITLNMLATRISPKESVFWANPLMVMYPVGSFDQSVTVDRLNRNDDDGRQVRYVPDPHRWYKLEPEPDIPVDGQLILNFGDSSTWGWGLNDRARAYPGALSELLPSYIRSVNLGVPGYSSLQGLRYLEELVPKYKKRIVAVTLYFGNNDSTENGIADLQAINSQRRPLNRLRRGLMQQLALARVMRDYLEGVAVRTNSIPRVSPREFEENLSRMVDLAKTHGIRIVIIRPSVPLSWPPGHVRANLDLQDQVRNPWTRDQLAQARTLYRGGLEQVARRSDSYEPLLQAAIEHDFVVPRIKSAWAQRLDELEVKHQIRVVRLPQFWIEAETSAFEDYCHPSPQTHYRIANLIKEALDL